MTAFLEYLELSVNLAVVRKKIGKLSRISGNVGNLQERNTVNENCLLLILCYVPLFISIILRVSKKQSKLLFS